MKPGKFVVVEGLEGAGKSSAVNLLKVQIEAAGHKVICTREPGGTPMAEAIRDCVKNHWQERVIPSAELLLMYAARVQLLENVIRPALQQGTWVIGDRHDLSSRAYQGAGHQLSDADIEPIRALALQGFRADLTLYLDVQPETGLERARGRGELDRIENQTLDFFQRARARFLQIAAQEPNIAVIDAMQPIAQVHEQILRQLNAFLEC